VTNSSTYLFGDTDLASKRLRLLADVYEPAMRDLLARWGPRRPGHAIDLGSGPGHSTRLLHEALQAARTTGIDVSPRFLAEAKRAAPAGVDFVEHDLLRRPFPVEPADVIYCRHLLAHVTDPAATLRGWTALGAPGARLLIQETETIASDDPTLARYYACVMALQDRRGQRIHVGGHLEAAATSAGGWAIEHSAVQALTLDPRVMATMHAMNLENWRTDSAAQALFDPGDLDDLGARLWAIASGEAAATAPVRNQLRDLVLCRG
jgi:trans-aconitate 2-methyltransferase